MCVCTLICSYQGLKGREEREQQLFNNTSPAGPLMQENIEDVYDTVSSYCDLSGVVRVSALAAFNDVQLDVYSEQIPPVIVLYLSFSFPLLSSPLLLLSSSFLPPSLRSVLYA